MRSIKIIMLFIAGAFVLSCSKEDDVTPEPQAKECHLVNFSNLNGQLKFAYDENGRVKTITGMYYGDEIEKRFYYKDNEIIIFVTENGEFYEKKTLSLNSKGQIVNDRTETNELGTTWRNSVYNYNGTELIKSSTTYHTGTIYEYIYSWNNGNLTNMTRDGAIVSSYEYTLDQEAKAGDFFHIQQFFGYGMLITPTKNLVTRIFEGTTQMDVDYVFDEEGKITSLLLITNSESALTNYKYQCD